MKTTHYHFQYLMVPVGTRECRRGVQKSYYVYWCGVNPLVGCKSDLRWATCKMTCRYAQVAPGQLVCFAAQRAELPTMNVMFLIYKRVSMSALDALVFFMMQDLQKAKSAKHLHNAITYSFFIKKRGMFTNNTGLCPFWLTTSSRINMFLTVFVTLWTILIIT